MNRRRQKQGNRRRRTATERSDTGAPGGVRLRPGRISPERLMPSRIARPPYARGPGALVPAVPPGDLANRMRAAGRAAREVLLETAAAVQPGVATDELDRICHEACIERDCYPSPLGYHGYPKSLCTSINEIVCHGIPDDRPLANGDIVNCDVTVYLDGVHGDCSETYLVGDVDEAGRRLVQVTKESLWRGVSAVHPGAKVCDIGRAVQDHAEAGGFGVVRMFVGHGIGEEFHCAPSVPHYYDPAASDVLEPGTTFTIEPMITEGSWEIGRIWPDGWTAPTRDGMRSAQFEHTLMVTPTGVEVLTLLPGESQSA